MKRKLRIAAHLGALVLIWTVMGLASANHRGKQVTAVHVIVEDGKENYFLDADAVKKILERKVGTPLEGTPVGSLRMDELEYELDNNPWIGNAEVFFRNDGVLGVEVALRKPLARVITPSGASFYLDEKMRKFPVSPSYPADVPLVTGYIRETLEPTDTLNDPALRGVTELIKAVHSDEFFSSMVSEIAVDGRGEITLYPEVGDLEMRFGKPEQIEEKLASLMKFYDQVLAVTGWNRYQSVDLRFQDQIVAKKRFNWL